jgi:ferritin-like metal-binding protein YciE
MRGFDLDELIHMSRTSSMKMEKESSNVEEVLIDEMRDLYDAENQLVKALPKIVKAAHDPELKKSFEEHLQKTEGHVSRLEKAFEMLGQKAKGKPCKGMMGLVEEGSEHIQEGK